jgi:uncharacterized protein
LFSRGAGPASETGYGPTAAKDRIESLDVLRGLALLMILIANMSGFNSPIYYLEEAGQQWWSSRADHVVQTLVFTFVQGESVTLFSFLFGLGFAMQLLRANSRAAAFLLIYIRRLLALIVLGLIHAYLIWTGDILALYGVLGFLLLFFRNLKPKVILPLALVLYLIPPARWEISLVQGISGKKSSDVTAQAKGSSTPAQVEALREVESSVHAYANGTWREITAQRARDYSYYLAHNQALTVFPVFLFGLYCGRRGFFGDLVVHRKSFFRAGKWSFAVAFTGTIVLRVLYLQGVPEWTALLRPFAYVIEHSALVIFYISAIVMLNQNERIRRCMVPLAAAGRQALSNYIFQSLVCTLIFYSYGLGYYGKVGPAIGVLLALLVFVLQLILSVLWLRRFNYGPVEWILRSITYGRLQVMRSRQAESN